MNQTNGEFKFVCVQGNITQINLQNNLIKFEWRGFDELDEVSSIRWIKNCQITK